MSDSGKAASRPRIRAKKACKSCNVRRVRCDVTEGRPCTNCKNANASCELMDSRRGKYDRHARRASTKAAEQNGTSVKQAPTDASQVMRQTEDFSHSYTAPETQLQSNPIPILDEPSPSIARILNHDTPNSNHSLSSSVHADSTVFLGESSSISVVHGPPDFRKSSLTNASDKSKLRYPIPDSVQAVARTSPFEARRRAARIEQLEREGAFTFPADNVCEILLREYFQWFHPCFPCLERTKFSQDYLSRTVSPLLLQAVLFIGATHCKPGRLESVGVTDRHELRSTLYYRAKDLYDADYETDKITVTQAVFLISFWRDGPTLEKDTRHWLGAAISLAQSKGMHRSSPNAVLIDRKLRKKIWWCLYIRDRQCAAALGLPTRIRDEDCDIELLNEDDFEAEYSGPIMASYFGTQKREHVLYICHMAKLAILLGKIVLREFSPGTSPYTNTDRNTLQISLEAWESALPREMRSNATTGSFWAGILHIAHDNLHILLYRSDYLKEQDSDRGDGHLALQAACRITRVVEDMLSEDQCGNGNLHMITSLFNSLCIHTIQLRRSENTARKLAEYRAQLCLLGLRELQKTWDVSNWVLQLFFQFLEQSTAQKLKGIYGERDDEANVSKTPISSRLGSVPPHSFEGTSNYATPSNVRQEGLGDGLLPARDPINNLHFESSHLFGTREAEDFSMFQLQPDLFNGDLFGGGLDQYYNTIFPREHQ